VVRNERLEGEQLDLAKAKLLRQALTAQGEELLGVLQERDADVLKAALKNPHLNEEHLLVLLKRRDLDEQFMKSLQRLPKVTGSRRLKMALAGHPSTPAPMLASLLPQLFLFELVTLMQLPGVGEDQKVAAEREILKRLPETETGSKLTLARRGSPAILEVLIREGKPQLLQAILANPKLKEPAIFAFLNSPTATPETISLVARHPRWGQRPNLRLAMLKNRKTPLVWFILFLPTLRKADLEALTMSKALTPEQLAEVREELRKRSTQAAKA
jgi:hypothetical protein